MTSKGTESWEDFYAEIDKRLDAVRPERIGAREKSWREPVYGWARNHIPDETNIVRHFAEKEVDNRETRATKRGNDLVRRWMHGEAPLSWAMVGPLPIIVDKVRVRLDVATPEDMEDAADGLFAKGKATWDEVLLLVQGFRDIARTARRDGHATVAQVGTLAPRAPGEGPQPYQGDPFDFDDEDDEE